MPFDPSTAKLEDSSAFDPSTATLEGEITPRPSRTSIFDLPASRLAFPTLGGFLGGLLTAPESFGAAAPLGGIGGAVGGESLRQFLASLTGGGPQTAQEQLRQLGTQAMTQATAETGAPVLQAGLRMGGRVGSAAIRNIASLFGIPTRATQHVLAQGPQAVFRPEYAEGIVPVSLRKKVVEGLEAFRNGAEGTYRAALGQLHDQIQGTSTNLKPVISAFRNQLEDARIIGPTGKHIRLELPPKVAQEVAYWNQRLVSIFDRLQRFRGQFLPTERAIDLKRQLDTLIDFSSEEVAKIPTSTIRMLKSLRNSLRVAIEDIVPALHPVNEAYHTFRDIYDDLQPSLRAKNIEATIQGLGNLRNTFLFRRFKDLESFLPKNKQFLDDVQNFLAAREFAKDPSPFVTRAEGVLGGILGFQGAGIPGVISGALLAPSIGSPRALARGLQIGERFMTRPISTATQAMGITTPATLAGILRLLGFPPTSDSSPYPQ